MPYQLVRVWMSNSNCRYNCCVGDIHSTCPAAAVSTMYICDFGLFLPGENSELLTAILMIRHARSFPSHSTSDKSLPTSKKSCQSRPPMTTWSMRAKPWRLFVTTAGCCTTMCPRGVSARDWLVVPLPSIHHLLTEDYKRGKNSGVEHLTRDHPIYTHATTQLLRPPCLQRYDHPDFKITLFTELRPPRF